MNSSMFPLLTRLEDDNELWKSIAELKVSTDLKGNSEFYSFRLRQTRRGSNITKDALKKKLKSNEYIQSLKTSRRLQLENEVRRKECKRMLDNLRNSNIRVEKPIGRKKLTCNFCGYSTTSKITLDVHLLRHGNKQRISKSKNIQSNGSHSESKGIMGNDMAPYKCLECPWSGKLLAHLNNHMLGHFKWEKSGLPPSDKSTSSAGQSSSHLAKISKEKEVSTDTKDRFNPHVNHTSITNFEPESFLSGLNASDKANLKIHQLTGSGRNKLNVYQCVKCSFKTCFETQIQSHLTVHRKESATASRPVERLFMCNLCSYASVSSELMEVHKKSHLEDNVICDQCGCQLSKNNYFNHSCPPNPDQPDVEMETSLDVDLNHSPQDQLDDSVMNPKEGNLETIENHKAPAEPSVETCTNGESERTYHGTKKIEEFVIYKSKLNQQETNLPNRHGGCELPAKSSGSNLDREDVDLDRVRREDVVIRKPEFRCDECSCGFWNPVRLANHKAVRHDPKSKHRQGVDSHQRRSNTSNTSQTDDTDRHKRVANTTDSNDDCGRANVPSKKSDCVLSLKDEINNDKQAANITDSNGNCDQVSIPSKKAHRFSILKDDINNYIQAPNTTTDSSGNCDQANMLSKENDCVPPLKDEFDNHKQVANTTGSYGNCDQANSPSKKNNRPFKGGIDSHKQVPNSEVNNGNHDKANSTSKNKGQPLKNKPTTKKALPEDRRSPEINSCKDSNWNPPWPQRKPGRPPRKEFAMPEFRCNECRNVFWTSLGLAMHKSTKHTGEYKFRCPWCEFGCNIEAERNCHVAAVHPNKPGFQLACNFCPFKCFLKGELIRHKKAHELDDASKDGETVESAPADASDPAPPQLDRRHVIEWDPRQLCHICGVVISHNASMRNHMASMHSEERPFLCPICGKGFKRESYLKVHVDLHEATELLICQANGCSYRTVNPKLFKIHSERHTNLYQCPDCDYWAKGRKELWRHRVHKHSTTPPIRLPCGVCDKSYLDLNNYTSHLRFMHGLRVHPHWISKPRHGSKRLYDEQGEVKDDPYEHLAPYLAMVAKLLDPSVPESEKVDLNTLYEKIDPSEWEDPKNPKKRTKNNQLLYVCELCGRAFGHKANLEYHIEGHSEDRPYKCDYKDCGYAAKRLRDLKFHTNIHSDTKAHCCTYCNYKTNKRSSLVWHVRTHTGERPHACDRCSFRSASTSALKVHMRVHTGERPYQCPHCPRAFKQVNGLRSHRCGSMPFPSIPQLDGEGLFACSRCDFFAANRLSLVQHQNNEHGKKRKSAGETCQRCLRTFAAKFELMRHKCSGGDAAEDKPKTYNGRKVKGQNCEAVTYKKAKRKKKAMKEELSEEDSSDEEEKEESEQVRIAVESLTSQEESDDKLKREFNELIGALDEVLSDGEDRNKSNSEEVLDNGEKSSLTNDSERVGGSSIDEDQYVLLDVLGSDNPSMVVHPLNDVTSANVITDCGFNVDNVGPEIVVCDVIEEICWDDQAYVVIAEANSGDLPSKEIEQLASPQKPLLENTKNQIPVEGTTTAEKPKRTITSDYVEKPLNIVAKPFVPPPEIRNCLVCKTCRKVLPNQDALAEHVEDHKKHRFRCALCSYHCPRSLILRKHMLKKHGIVVEKEEKTQPVPADKTTPERLMCLVCDFRSDSRKALETHLQEHKGVKFSACETCDRKFHTCYQMTHHVCSAEPQDPLPKSEVAEPTATDDLISQALGSSGIQSEIEKEDMPSPVRSKKSIFYKCSACNASFADVIVLQDHIQRHTDDGLTNISVNVVVC